MMHALASSVGIERLHFLKQMEFTWQLTLKHALPRLITVCGRRKKIIYNRKITEDGLIIEVNRYIYLMIIASSQTLYNIKPGVTGWLGAGARCLITL